MEVSGQLHAPAALPHCTHRTEAWVGPRVGLDAVAKRTKFVIAPDGHGTQVVQPVA